MRIVVTCAALGIALVSFAAFSFTANNASADTTVDVGNNYFCSKASEGGTCTTNITAGDTVTWSVSGGFHTVTQCNTGHTSCPIAGGFDSSSLEQGQTFAHTFSDVGSFDYYCAFHPSDMFGVINVSAAPTPTPTPAPTVPGSTPGPTAVPVAQPSGPSRTGGPLSEDSSNLWLAMLAALGVAMIAGSATLAYAAVRRR